MKNLTHNFDTKIKYQKYSHYLLPIAINPLEYGKLIEQFGNKYIIQLNTSNILVIKTLDNENFIRFFRKGDLMIEFIDTKISDIKFTRTISDQRFTFEKNKLITTEILSQDKSINIFTEINTDAIQLKQNSINPLLILLLISPYFNDNFLDMSHLGLIPFKLIISNSFVSGIRFYSMKGNIVKLRRSLNRNAWDEYKIPLNNKIFSKNLFEKLIRKFWNNIEDRFTNNNHLYLLFKIQYTDGNFVTLGSLQRLNKEDLSWYIDLILSLIQFKSEYYKEDQIKEIIITYGFKNEKIPNKIIIASTKNKSEFNKINIINSMIPSDFGLIIKTIKTEKSTIFIIQNELNQTITLEQFDNYNLVTIAFKGKILI